MARMDALNMDGYRNRDDRPANYRTSDDRWRLGNWSRWYGIWQA